MSSFESFRALNCAGAMIRDPKTVTTLSLLFEKVYLPNDLEIVTDFARRFKFKKEAPEKLKIKISPESGHEVDDPFENLTPEQRKTANQYLANTIIFAERYLPLYGKVFESPCYPKNSPFDIELVKKGKPRELNTYRVTKKNGMTFRTDGSDEIASLITNGYVPLLEHSLPAPLLQASLDSTTSTQIASLLAMNAVRLTSPRMKVTNPETILEARERLKDHLPPFWAEMLKLSKELRQRIQSDMDASELNAQAQDLVEDTVRPALIELKHKLELERKLWFYRILSPIQKGLRLLIGNPLLTQQQILTNALVMGSDVAMAGASHMQQIEALKNGTGITMLLETAQIMDDDNS